MALQAREPQPILVRASDYENLREAGRINGRILAALREAVQPGMKTRDFDAIARQMMSEAGGVPPFLNYVPPGASVPPYPAHINVSVNEELVHGIPGNRKLKRGDVVTLDCGTAYNGLIADSALTVVVGGEAPDRVWELIRATEEALNVAIQVAKPGRHIGDVSFAIQSVLERYRVSIPPQFGGHGVGYVLHGAPHVANMGRPGAGIQLVPGMALAIEPMAMLGKPDTVLLRDRWTVVSKDKSICAHSEHSILVTEEGVEVLTLLPEAVTG